MYVHMNLNYPQIIKAIDWLEKDNGEGILFKEDHCPFRDIFQARLDRMTREMEKNENFKSNFSIISAIAGELGNNAFDHNLGKWRDQPGIYFVFDLEQKFFVIADRGQGILASLKRVRKDLETEREALQVAFTESISGRAPEQRGNGLKFVKKIIEENHWKLYFHSGNGRLEINNGYECGIDVEKKLSGVLAVIYF